MNLSLDVSVPVITVFIQGLLSFFSPCVLPLIPVYIGYLSGGTREADESGGVHYNKKKVLINTFFFV
nr:cytochrome C biogenesis protein [Lachnospiraceae bacterium]